MKRVTRLGRGKEAAHMRNLRLKLRRELPPDLLEDCATLASLEHRKEVYDGITRWKTSSKATERKRAISFEEAAWGEALA